jgi:hypothetical protein
MRKIYSNVIIDPALVDILKFFINLCNSMPNRSQEVLGAAGEHTRY